MTAMDSTFTRPSSRTTTRTASLAKWHLRCHPPATKDLDGSFDRLQASDAEVVQEPTEQPYGVRDCAVRDPAGNLIRIQELR